MRHVVAVILVVAFCALGYWQYMRASGGNTLSWAYTFEWPLFAAFTVALWVHEVRAELKRAGGVETAGEPPLTSPFEPGDDAAPAPTGDAATDAYNRYLAWLAADPGRRPGEYPG